MQGLFLGVQIFLAYAAMIGGLIFLIGAGILFSRTKTAATAMFFFGLLFSTLIGPLGSLLLQKVGVHSIIQPFSLVAILAAIIQVIGFLLYALSLPKK